MIYSGQIVFLRYADVSEEHASICKVEACKFRNRFGYIGKLGDGHGTQRREVKRRNLVRGNWEDGQKISHIRGILIYCHMWEIE
jgi:hypothetical protein